MKKLTEIIIDIAFIFLIILMAYATGSSIVLDYISHGIKSVIISFVIGIPLITITFIIFRKVNRK